jgi:uncharacterized Tic20 family protein
MGHPGPGWYHDGTAMRWWDGSNWGPYAPAPAAAPAPAPAPAPTNPDEQDRATAIIAHLGALFGGWFIVALVIYLVSRSRRESFAFHHAAEALNFQLTLTAAVIVPWILAIATLAGDPDGGTFPWFFLVGWLLMMVIGLAGLVLSIVAAVRASRLERWRYPVSIRFVGRTKTMSQ